MAVIEKVKIDTHQSIRDSLNEVDKIRSGKLPKNSYKNMITKVRKELSEQSK